jgi:GR25 family glycosyltransferase involved in LPS biosynthesis
MVIHRSWQADIVKEIEHSSINENSSEHFAFHPISWHHDKQTFSTRSHPSIDRYSQPNRALQEARSSNGKDTSYRYPEIFWINMNTSSTRRRYMESQLQELGLVHQRIPAVTPNSTLYRLEKLEKPCRRNTGREIAVIISHLVAIFTAIYKPSPLPSAASSSSASNRSQWKMENYALIMEDDVRWEFLIDFEELLSLIPSDAGILQLMTSNPEAIVRLWNRFNASSVTEKNLWKLTNWKDTSKGGRHALYWSCQAYLINKAIVKSFIDDVVSFDPLTLEIQGFKIINSFHPRNCVRTKKRPCILANCLFSDTYIYSGGGPTYVSRIPLFNGGLVGFRSEIHQEQVMQHQKAFQMVSDIVNRLKRYGHESDLSPDTIRQMEEEVHWDGAGYTLKWNRYQYLPSFLQPLYHDINGSLLIS